MNLNVINYLVLNNTQLELCYFKETNDVAVFVGQNEVPVKNNKFYIEGNEYQIVKDKLFYNGNKILKSNITIRNFEYKTKVNNFKVKLISNTNSPNITITVNDNCIYQNVAKEKIELTYENQTIVLNKEKIFNRIPTFSLKINSKEKTYFYEDQNVIKAYEMFVRNVKNMSFLRFIKNMISEGLIVSILMTLLVELELYIQLKSISEINPILQIVIFFAILLVFAILFVLAKLIRFKKYKKS